MMWKVVVPAWFLAIGWTGMWLPAPTVPVAVLLLVITVVVPSLIAMSGSLRVLSALFRTAQTRR